MQIHRFLLRNKTTTVAFLLMNLLTQCHSQLHAYSYTNLCMQMLLACVTMLWV